LLLLYSFFFDGFLVDRLAVCSWFVVVLFYK